jgi:UDP-N-acetylmuramate--alanine ligase
VFQPHTFSRTQRMLYRMGESFEQANAVIVLDIYAAREVDDGSVNAAELVASSPHPRFATFPRWSRRRATWRSMSRRATW